LEIGNLRNEREREREREVPLSERKVEEGNIDVLIRVIIGYESRLLLHHEPLAGVLQIRLKPVNQSKIFPS
jgi:hypothetical protein